MCVMRDDKECKGDETHAIRRSERETDGTETGNRRGRPVFAANAMRHCEVKVQASKVEPSYHLLCACQLCPLQGYSTLRQPVI